jgi:outer membrane protein TolC
MERARVRASLRRGLAMIFDTRCAVALATAAVLFGAPVRAEQPANDDERELQGPLRRESVLRASVARSPAVNAAILRARASATEAGAEGSLPPPEAMAQVWQVPLARPYAVNDAQMIMIGVSQSFPAPGSLGAREAAKLREARAEEAIALGRARLVARDADHAYTDYVASVARHRVHQRHEGIAARVLDLAERRQVAGGSLADVADAEVESARVQADVIGDAARVEAARARLNALLVRAPNAALGAPVETEPSVPAWGLDAILARARATRPELRAAEEQREAKREGARAAEREATWPSFTLGALYFAPTTPMPFHGYGLNASMSLPWLSGGASRRRDAQRQMLAAETAAERGARVDVDQDVVTAESSARAAALRLRVLRDRALPASRRGFDVAWAGYESGRIELARVMAAERTVVDIENDVVAARAELDHALAELDAAVGAPVPRGPLGPLVEGKGGAHGSPCT